VRYTGGQFAERRHFFLDDDLFLGLFQFVEGVLERVLRADDLVVEQ
jgi:hypothetical protein